MKPQSFQEILLVGYAGTGLDNLILKGIVNYRQNKNRSWLIRSSNWQGQDLQDMLDRHNFAGIIGNIASESTLEILSDSSLPIINTSGQFPNAPFPVVQTKAGLIGFSAAEFLNDLGHQRLFYVMTNAGNILPHQLDHWNGLKAFAIDKKISAWCWNWSTAECFDQVGDEELLPVASLSGPFKALEIVKRPYGLIASGERLGRELCEGCLSRRLNVPEAISILSTNDDESMCELSTPSLSGVRQAGEQIGDKAAELLDRRINNKSVPEITIIDTLTIIPRASTESNAVQDPFVAELLHRMRANLHRPTSIKELSEHIGLERRTLERRFRNVVQRSPLNQLYTLRVERACELLRDTSLNVSAIAAQCGFSDGDHFTQRFKRIKNESPSKYREKHQRKR